MNPSSPLVLRIPRGVKESFELKIVITQPRDLLSSSAWETAME